jgi:hypothetical protein
VVRCLPALVIVFVAAGCVDTKVCHTPIVWKPCAGQSAQPGSSGSPPSIVELSLPTCAYVDTPIAAGSLKVTDPDSDAAVVKSTFSAGARLDESELVLDDMHRSDTDWSDDFSLTIAAGSGGMLTEMTEDVSVKVVDTAGAQSIPFCHSISLVR